MLKGIYLYLVFIGEDFELFKGWGKEMCKDGYIKDFRKDLGRVYFWK